MRAKYARAIIGLVIVNKRQQQIRHHRKRGKESDYDPNGIEFFPLFEHTIIVPQSDFYINPVRSLIF